MMSGREGITAHGQAISVVGDNIANSNTTGFKESRVEFADLFSDGNDGNQVDTLPSSGNGVMVKEVRQIYVGGSIESTGRELDVGIDGNGFFILGSEANPTYTRAGNFSIDGTGQLVNSDGLPVLGFPAGSTALAPLNFANLNVTGTATTAGSISGILDARQPISTPPTNPTSFSQIKAAGGFPTSLTAYDSLGASHDINLYYFRTADNTWTANAYVDGSEVGGTEGQPTLIGSTTLTFQSDGSIAEADKAAATLQAQNIAWGAGAAPGNIALDLSGFSQYAATATISSNTQNGAAIGNVSGYSIGEDGKVEAILDSGTRRLIGTIQLADFNNRDGLERAGSNSFRPSGDVGALDPGAPGSGVYGGLRGGSLERSTVDLSSQFVDLVLYQRGYQANSQTITAVNQLIQNTIGMIR
jgi:flagellar hook protein FlgE